MSQKAKILLFLILISLLLIIYLIVSSEPVTIKQDSDVDQSEITKQSDDKASQVDLAELENNYQKEVRTTMADFEQLIEKVEAIGSTTSLDQEPKIATSTTDHKIKTEILEKTSYLRNHLMEMKVPTKFKDLHLNLVLALNKMDSYINDRKEEEKLTSIDLIKEAKINYEWLND